MVSIPAGMVVVLGGIPERNRDKRFRITIAGGESLNETISIKDTSRGFGLKTPFALGRVLVARAKRSVLTALVVCGILW